MKQLLFTLSKANGDFVVQPFKGSGKGGQKRNKTMSACRIVHPESGCFAESQEERSFTQNKKIAFDRLTKNPEFLKWFNLEAARRSGVIAALEAEVDKSMSHVKVEVVEEGRWVEEKEV